VKPPAFAAIKPLRETREAARIVNTAGRTQFDETGLRTWHQRLQRGVIMSDIKKDATTSSQKPASKSPSDEADLSKELDEVADEMAGEAGKAENRYDEGHNIFTK
jgi:hypothetical protein